MSLRIIPSRRSSVKSADNVLPGLVVLEGSVGYGGANKARDVLAVQESLNEVAIEAGGSSLTVDGRCRDKTIAAILRFQQQWVSYRDSRIDPDGATLQALNGAVGVRSGANGPAMVAARFVAAAGSGSDVQHKRAKQERQLAASLRLSLIVTILAPRAYRCCLAALRLVAAARRHVSRLPAQGSHAPFDRDDPDRLRFLIVAKHFKLHESRQSEAVRALRKIEDTLRRMTVTLVERAGQAAGTSPLGTKMYVCNLYQPADANLRHALGYTNLGAVNWRGGTIHFPPEFDSDDLDSQQNTVLHEVAHYAGPQFSGAIDDLGYTHERKYIHNTTDQRLRNAAAYAIFAHECGLGSLDAVGGSGGGGISLRVMQPQIEMNGSVTLVPAERLGGNDVYAYPSGYISQDPYVF